MTNKGFTLVELLITIALIAVISIISSDFLINMVATSVSVQNKADVEQTYSFVTTKLVKLLEEADTVEVNNTNNFNQITLTADQRTYVIRLNTTQNPQNQLLIGSSIDTLKPINTNTRVKILNIPNTENFSYKNTSNPIQIALNLRFEVAGDLSSAQEVSRVVTVRKSYIN